MKRRGFIFILVFVFAFTPVFTSFHTLQANAPTSTREIEEVSPIITSYLNKWAVIPEVDRRPEADGDLDDSVWENVKRLSDFVTVYDNDPVVADIELKLAFDKQNLYIRMAYEDQHDSLANFELLLSTDVAGESYYSIPVQITDLGHPIINDWGPGMQTLENYSSEVDWQDQTVTAEVAIPFSALDVDGVTAGDEWRFNAIVQHEMDTNPLSSWVPIRTSSYFSYSSNDQIDMYANVSDEGRMGSIYFGQMPDTWVPDSNKEQVQKVIPWEPQQATLVYHTFTEKELFFEEGDLDSQEANVTLKWKSPNGSWTDIEQWQLNEVGDRFNVSFQHPEPTEKGIYMLLVVVSQDDKSEAEATLLTFDQLSLIRAGNLLFAEEGDAGEAKTPVTPAPPSEEIEKMLELIPDKNGFASVGLPDNPGLRPYGAYDWSPTEPHVLTSPHSDLTYPNEQYPEDKVFIVQNRKGESVEYPYYEDENGKRYFISAHLWYQQKRYVAGEMPRIAEEDPLGAARLLYKFAQVYEGYVLTHERDWKTYPIDPTTGPPYPYYGGNAWYWWSPAALVDLSYLADAFAIVKQTDAFDVLSEEVGEKVEGKIVEEMFKPSVEYARTFPILNTNMDYYNWLGLTDLGKALNDPSYIHEAVERVEDYVMNTYLFDGFFKETTLSYHRQSTGGLDRAITNLAGWSDPEGYVSPRSGMRLEELDMRAKFPALGKAREIAELLVYPDGKYLPTQDTWAFQKSSNPRADTDFLMPASGIARMARETTSSGGQLVGWTPFNVTDEYEPSAEHVYEGQYSVKIVDPDETVGPGLRSSRVAVVPGTNYQVSGYSFNDPGKSHIYLEFWNEAGQRIRPVIVLTNRTLNQWEKIEGSAVAPDDAVHATVLLSLDSTNVGTSFFDNVSLKASGSEEELISNPGFEDVRSQEQLYLTFQPKYGHHHFDPLNLTLYAENQELLPDIGYTHTFYRRWTNSTLAHNTVVVDGEDMVVSEQSKHGGNIDVFAPINDRVQVMRAEQKSAYTQTDEYSREPWFIKFPTGDGYVLDLFRVSGGDRHEYTLQGDANHDAAFESDISFRDYGPYLLPEGVDVRDPEDQYDTGSAEGHYYGYIYVRNVKKADIEDGRYDMTLVTEDEGEEKAKMKITGLIEPGQNELFLGESPSLRATRLHGTSMDNNDEADKYTMPKMVLRREGSNLTSSFITAMEPYANGEAPRIETIERLEPDQAVTGDIAVKVSYGDTIDIIMSSLNPDQPLVVGDMALEGKMGMIRLRDGVVQNMYLVGGSSLKKGNVSITDDGPVTGSVTEVHRQAAGDGQDAFITDTPVPADMQGKTIVITHPDGKTHGYKISNVTVDNEQSVIEITDMDPGFSINENETSALMFYPFTEWKGTTTFRIENTVQGSGERAVSVDALLKLLQRLQGEGAFESDQAVHALRLHLTAVSRFEQQEEAEKVVKHMKGFKLLLDHQQDNDLISEEVHTALRMDTESMIKQWQ